MDAQKLYEMMKKVQEPKGYFFNKDKERTVELLDGLIANKERYGYMGCPCRLLSGDRKADRDIICPCIYVSIEWNDGAIPHEYVPERRPVEKMPF
jgi:ferredoxin-thioredoxin reductase catalytic chain